MEKAGYVLLGIVFLIYLVAIFVGLIAAMPWGIVGLIAIAGVGLLLMKVVTDRIENKEDDYYDKNVKM
ncbi:hypothetical protein B6D60_03315 [candidate division KSB1 bacterium 4484_87]|nr:MAG: hypothetical protein B6D60_03315 [candidate division KSB1 bacterium 4484_87]